MSLREIFRSVDTGNRGYVEKAEVGRLLQALDPGTSVSQNDILFVLNEVELTGDDRLSFVEFRKWHTRARKGHKGSRFNKLLVKDLVGKGRTSSYDLPSKQFTFGYVIPRDVNDAKEVISNWQSGKERVSGSEILKARNTRGAPSRRTTYGHVNRPSTPMGKLIQGEFAGASHKEAEYPQRPTHVNVTRKVEQAARERRAVTEAASRGKSLRQSGERVLHDNWKMKKFTKVRSRVFAGDAEF